MPPKRDWAIEMSKNGRNPETPEEFKEMIKQMDKLGLKGPYNPKNLYPGSPWTPTSFPSAAEVQARAKASSEKVLEDWNTLRRIVERHHETLEKRWAKKTKKKQKDLLLAAWPNMSPSHRPDFEAFRKENTGRALKGLSKYPEAYLWPFINLQDLCSRSLTIFVKSRAQNPPSAFARADINATHLASVTHSVEEPAFLMGYTLFMDGDTVETYGKLVSWEKDNQAADLMFSQRQFTPGEGLRVLQIQEKVYPFLIKCCELVLHDLVVSGSLFDEQFPIVEASAIASEPLLSAETEISPNLAQITVEAPYRLPAQLDFDRIRAIIAARRSAAEDHLLALREDPGYFAETVNDWSEHRNDRLLDTRGRPHPTGPHTTEFWERVIRNVIADAYSGFMNWDLLLSQVNNLIKLKEKYKDQIKYESQLPKEYLVALLKFNQLLVISCENPIFYLRNIQSSPPLRQYFTREPQMPGTINMHIRPINETDPFFHKPWGLLLILWDEQQRELFGVTNVVDAFEQLMQDPNEKRNISPYISDLLADLGIITRVLHEIELYQPWAATFEEEHGKHSKEVMEIFEEAGAQMQFMEQMDHVMKGIVPLAMPGDGKFNYPIDKKRTKAVTDTLRNAEANLDIFWERFDFNFRLLAHKSLEASMAKHIPKHRGQPLERTPPWVEPAKEFQTQPQKSITPKEWTDSQEDKLVIRTKQKLKTKGTAAASETDPNPAPTPSAQSDAQHLFKVDKAALKVFNALFYTPRQEDPPRQVQWRDFLHAMASAGFEVQKLYGSIWQFTPTNLDVERSIQFHEPHPDVKVRFAIAKRMGRRLQRAYGWHGGMFELE